MVRGLLAVQSQDYPGATWALAQRSAGAPTAADVDALFDAGAFVRTHVLRPTWHFVAAEDLRWLLAVTAPRVHQASAFQYRTLGIEAALAARAIDVFGRELEGGRSKTREELMAALRVAGFQASGLLGGYLLMWGELEAVLCSGPRRGKRQTYALLEERLPPSRVRERDEALAEIATRYVRGHGPAQDVDLAWWSGLTIRDARRGLEMAGAALRREAVEDRTFWVDPEEADAADSRATAAAMAHRPIAQLLPNYDELLIAFRDRSDAADPALPPAAQVAEKILAHVLVRDGLVVGGWRRREGPRTVRVELSPLVPLDATELAALEGAIRRFEAFLGRPVEEGPLD